MHAIYCIISRQNLALNRHRGVFLFYQNHSYLATERVKLENGIDFSFPLHLHSSYEFIVVTEGEMEVSVDGKSYTLFQEDALLIFPNQVHSLRTQNHSCHFLCIFSPKLVQAYTKLVTSKIPTDNCFRPDFYLVENLASLTPNDSIMNVKGTLYSICALFDKNRTYIEKTSADEELISRIFKFVENNFNGDCSLEALSKHTSYHYVYLSKYFKRCTGVSYTDYVNRYRINEACYILQNSSQSILQTAYDCGFDSLRSFNRNFKRIIGTSPSSYQMSL